MSDADNEQLRPPPSWDKFEEICADLFSRIKPPWTLVRENSECYVVRDANGMRAATTSRLSSTILRSTLRSTRTCSTTKVARATLCSSRAPARTASETHTIQRPRPDLPGGAHLIPLKSLLDPGRPKMLVPRLAPGAWDTWTCLWLISRWQLCPALACWCALLARTLLGIRFRNSSGSTSSFSARRPMTFMLT